MTRKLTLFALTVLLGFFAVAAHADTISFTLTNPQQYVSASSGGTLTYDVSIAAPSTNSNTYDLFGVTGDFTLMGGSLDPSDFYASVPEFFAPGDTYNGALFSLIIPAGSAPGNYLASLDIRDPMNAVIGSVQATATVTPEPSSLMLLGTGAVGALAAFRRKRFGSV